MLKKLIFIYTFFMVVSGCAMAPSSAAKKIMDADQNMVKNCEFKGSVSGTSGWGNLASSAGINNAKNEAKGEAAKLGATHVIWLSVFAGSNPNVSGNAYKC